MKIFVIHSGNDKQAVKEQIAFIENATISSEILMLKNGGKLWKFDAGNMIKQAQLVLLFVGAASFSSSNIAWEINAAKKAGKTIFTVLLAPENQLPSALYVLDDFTREMKNCSMIKTTGEVIDAINEYNQGNYALFNYEEKELDKKTLLEQYKIFLQTSETLVQRRQNVNNFYITVNSALISIFSIVSVLGFESLMKCYMGIIFAIIGIILCISWIRILNSYAILNASKMKIISLIEKQLPANLYDAEWRVQSDKLNKRPYVSFTASETRIPKIFICIYIVIAICALAFIVLAGNNM